jgi:phosphoglycerol transferase
MASMPVREGTAAIRRRSHAVRFLAYFAGIFAAALALWVGRMFGSPTIDQVLYHLHFAEGAAIRMSEVFVATFLVEVLGAALVLAAVATALHAQLAQGRRAWHVRGTRAAPHLIVGSGLALLLAQFSAFSWAAAHFEKDHFAQAYRDPATVPLKEARQRNLILVYVESLEDTYSDPELFGSDLLAPLRAVGGQSLPAYHAAPGATWTIAAMVATQCGIPLEIYDDDDEDEHKDRARTFLPGATCLGDLLQARGYRSVFMGGAPLSFSGKGEFLRDHGYEERWGKDEWLDTGARPPGTADPEMGGWGMYDDALFAHARERLAALRAAGQPFNLTLLTLDTHNPDGYLSPRCRRQALNGSEDAFESIVRCTSVQLAQFVQFVREQGYLQDTTLVIIGDHPAVGNPVDAKLRSVADRHVFNLFVGAPTFPLHVQPLVSFDMFPTLLEAIGMRAPEGRLALGRSAWSPDTAPSEWVVHPNLPALAGSAAYQRLWTGKPR